MVEPCGRLRGIAPSQKKLKTSITRRVRAMTGTKLKIVLEDSRMLAAIPDDDEGHNMARGKFNLALGEQRTPAMSKLAEQHAPKKT